MKIAFTWYPKGENDVTVWVDMPQCPAMGDSVAFDADERQRIWTVTSRPRWVQEDGFWHAEVH